MRQMSLANNNIRVIQPFAFSQLPNLQMLDLSGNRIDSMPPTTFGFTQATIMLHGNVFLIMICYSSIAEIFLAIL